MRVDTSELREKDYLGDGVYVGHDGYQLWVWTQDGDSIALEPPVIDALNAYWARVSKPAAAP